MHVQQIKNFMSVDFMLLEQYGLAMAIIPTIWRFDLADAAFKEGKPDTPVS
jgi:hypothetical protein